jgi:hypothetical protein
VKPGPSAANGFCREAPVACRQPAAIGDGQEMDHGSASRGMVTISGVTTMPVLRMGKSGTPFRSPEAAEIDRDMSLLFQ